MFHVLDHAEVVYTGELSQATQYVIEHYSHRLDEAIRSGIKIAYSDGFQSLDSPGQIVRGSSEDDFWNADEDWDLD